MEQRHEAVDAFLTASRVLVGVAVRSVDEAASEVTVAQHRLLVLLAGRGAQRVSDLARHLGVNTSNATRHVDRLQRLGLVVRERPVDDRRTVCVSLTPAGRALLDRVTDARRSEIGVILERMPDQELAGLLRALRAFGEAAGEPYDSGWARATD